MKTSELTRAALNWAVAKCVWPADIGNTVPFHRDGSSYAPSTNWAHGGPIIERERIATSPLPNNSWRAYAPMGTRVLHGLEIFDWQHKGNGPTPLIAAMRCFVASKMGDEIEVPEELK